MYPGCISAVWCGHCDKPVEGGWSTLSGGVVPGVRYQTVCYIGPGWIFTVYCGEVDTYGGLVVGLPHTCSLSASPCSMAL
jgi:hypothetical protein